MKEELSFWFVGWLVSVCFIFLLLVVGDTHMCLRLTLVTFQHFKNVLYLFFVGVDIQVYPYHSLHSERGQRTIYQNQFFPSTI